MKKNKLIIILIIIAISLTGCAMSSTIEKSINHGELTYRYNDGIKGKVEFIKIGNERFIRFRFDKRKKDTKVKIAIKYYQEDNKVYEDNINYTFPEKSPEYLLDVPIATVYYDRDVKEMLKVYYDHIEVDISK